MCASGAGTQRAVSYSSVAPVLCVCVCALTLLHAAPPVRVEAVFHGSATPLHVYAQKRNGSALSPECSPHVIRACLCRCTHTRTHTHLLLLLRRRPLSLHTFTEIAELCLFRLCPPPPALRGVVTASVAPQTSAAVAFERHCHESLYAKTRP